LQKERDLFAQMIGHFGIEKLAVLRGAALVQYGRYEEAAEVLKNKSDGSAMFWTTVGNAQWGSGHRDKALDAYLQALDVVPAFRPAVQRLVQMAFSETVRGEVEDVYDELPTVEWIDRGITAVRQKKWNQARMYFGAALDRERRGDVSFALSEKTRSAVQTLPDSVFAAGGAAYELGDLEGALSAYVQVVKLDPERTDAYTLMGLIKADQGAFLQAEQHLYDALLVDVSYVPALTILGTVFQERNDLDAALALYRQAWALEPSAAGVELFMGQVYMMQSNRDSARAVLSRVVKREPNHEQARELLNQVGGLEL
jgi:tetratricopeptide (TPR) repeat protein